MNDNLVSVNHGQIVTNSRQVAVHFEKQHQHVIRDIENIVDKAEEKDASKIGRMFFETTMPDVYGRMKRVYLMTRNGVDYFLSGKYQPKGDPKPKAFISLHGPSEGILRAMGGALYRIATDTKASPVSRLIFVASLREMLDDASHALDDQIIELHRKGDTRHEN